MLKYTKPRWKELEKEFIQDLAVRRSMLIEHSEEITKLYYLTCPNVDELDTREVYICIHGTGGTSLSFVELIPHFPRDSRFYLLDLPGFGKSHTRGTRIGFSDYTRWIREFMDNLHLTSARFIAHSFGAVFVTHFAHAHPDYVKSVTLISPALLLPTLSYNGVIWAILFKMRFPYILQYVRWGIYLLYYLFSKGWFKTFNQWERRVCYYLSCYGDRKSTMGELIANCITLGWNWGYGNSPILGKLLTLEVPIALIYGEHDTISPSHGGLLIRGLRADIRVDILRNEGHNPIPNAPELIVQRAKSTGTISVDKRHVQRIQKILSKPEQYASTFGYHTTWTVIHRLYTDLLTC